MTPPTTRRALPRQVALAATATLAVMVLAVSMFAGSGGMAPVIAPHTDLDRIVLLLRLARALSGFAVGGLLALSGAIAQALLRNPLADPYVLGISAGAAFFAVIALWLGLPLAGVQGGAVLGALAALAALWTLTRRLPADAGGGFGDGAVTAVLLTGTMIASFFAALLGLVLTLAPDGRLRPIVFWLLGDLGGAVDLTGACAALLLLVVLAALAWRDARALNLMLHGAAQAFTQGVDVDRVRWRLIVIAAIATGCAVTLAGAVGFVGFVAPHIVRRLGGNDQRWLLPGALLVGAIVVTAADAFARTAFAPLQLPVGVVTALIGAPTFVWMLRRWP